MSPSLVVEGSSPVVDVGVNLGVGLVGVFAAKKNGCYEKFGHAKKFFYNII